MFGLQIQYRGIFYEAQFDIACFYPGPQWLNAGAGGGHHRRLQRHDQKQKKEPGDAFVSTVLFDDQNEVLHDRVKVGVVRPITEKEYYVRGCTALLDAVGRAIHHVGNIHKYARPKDVPEHTLFAITTDGMENASHHYSARWVKEMIQR